MRKRHKLIDLQMSLHQELISRRKCLSDVPYKSLTPEVRAEIEDKANRLYHPLMMREKVTVWRFLNRDGL